MSEIPEVDIQFTVGKLRDYCKACHAVGTLRFIRSDDNLEVWRYLFANRSPSSDKLWAEAIIDTLNWPTDQAPPFDRPRDPARGRDWMPKGAKRQDLAVARHEGQVVRRLMIDNIRRELTDRSR